MEPGIDSTLGAFGAQSALLPAGAGAAATNGLTVAMTAGFTAIFVVMLVIVWLAWRGERPARRWWIVAGGVVLPLVAVALVFAGSTRVLRAVAGEGEAALTIAVTGHQYWWDVVYDPEGLAIRDANEVVVPVGVPVRLELRSQDVIHSFWVPRIAGKMDMIPGRVNETVIEAAQAGRFRGQCAEFCGLSHPLMAFEMVAVPPERFRTFLGRLRDGASDVAGPAAPGREVFVSSGCPACHEIRGVAEGARIGPDLTRVGGRAALGAGMWETSKGSLAGWIADVQDLKPGAQMPSYEHLGGAELRALAGWLEALK